MNETTMIKKKAGKKKKLPKLKNTEADIFFDFDPEMGPIVIKRYRTESECVQWLNTCLSQYYDPSVAMPLAQHEFAALKILSEAGIAPRPIELRREEIRMEFAGDSIISGKWTNVPSYRAKAEKVLGEMRRLNFRHNDMCARNVVFDGNDLKVVDLTLSEFGGIKLLDRLPNPKWAKPGRDKEILNFEKEMKPFQREKTRERRWARRQRLTNALKWAAAGFSNRRRLKRLSRGVYNYHNLGSGLFPENEEKTPVGAGERYNFDRMYYMISHYDFHGKNVVDLGCNSGWFSIQAKLLGAGKVAGIDYAEKGIMGPALQYAQQFEKTFRFGIQFTNAHLERTPLSRISRDFGIKQFDCALLLSVLHHIGKSSMLVKSRFFLDLYENVKDVIFYEDHEFWNEIYDDKGALVSVAGDGYRFGWNEDMSWQRKMGPLEIYEDKILAAYRNTWRKEVLMMNRFSRIQFLGFSEKRRPLLALHK